MKLFMDHIASPDWAVRRRIIILSLIWEAALITYLVVYPWPNSIAEVAIINVSGLFGTTVGAYIFGAVWDKKNMLKADVAQSATDQADEINVEVKQ